MCQNHASPHTAEANRAVRDLLNFGDKQVAEEVGFEPTEDLHLRWFSRPVHSTTLPLLRLGARSSGVKVILKHLNSDRGSAKSRHRRAWASEPLPLRA